MRILLLLLPLWAAAQPQELSQDNAPPGVASGADACTSGIKARPGKFCEDVESCKKFCGCACDFDLKKWRPLKKGEKNDGSVACPRAPETGPGMLAANSTELAALAHKLAYIETPKGLRATKEAIAGLEKLAAQLENSENRKAFGYSMRVGSCYRAHQVDTDAECGFVLKSQHVLAVSKYPAQIKEWTPKANPQNVGLAWPGATPHSGGYACDIVLLDKNSQDCFDYTSGMPDSPTCLIAAQRASQMMDEELTKAGARRLSYEAWHYEWGPHAKGCQSPDCPWPARGRP